jgi:hypothetical protein
VFRDHADFADVPIKLHLRKRESSEPTDEIDIKRREPGAEGREAGEREDSNGPAPRAPQEDTGPSREVAGPSEEEGGRQIAATEPLGSSWREDELDAAAAETSAPALATFPASGTAAVVASATAATDAVRAESERMEAERMEGAPAATSNRRRHPQTSPRGLSIPSFPPLPWRRIGLCLVSVAAVALVWWLLSGRPIHPEGRYLPNASDRFLSIHWRELAQGGNRLRGDLPGLTLIPRCKTFLRNAGLEPEDLVRVNAGPTQDALTELVVYRFDQAVSAETMMEKDVFAAYELEMIRGVPVYVWDNSAIAFPGEQTAVNGQTALVREVVRGRQGFRPSSSGLMATLDFEATVSGVTDGPPPCFSAGDLLECEHLLDTVRATTDDYRYGENLQFKRTLHLSDPEQARELCQCLDDSLAAARDKRDRKDPAREMIGEVQVLAEGNVVEIRLTVENDPLPSACVEAIHALFD